MLTGPKDLGQGSHHGDRRNGREEKDREKTRIVQREKRIEASPSHLRPYQTKVFRVTLQRPLNGRYNVGGRTWTEWGSNSKGLGKGRRKGMLVLLCTEKFPKVQCLPKAAHLGACLVWSRRCPP